MVLDEDGLAHAAGLPWLPLGILLSAENSAMTATLNFTLAG
jgi:hypothetical protein